MNEDAFYEQTVSIPKVRQKKIRVFISSPYTNGDQVLNVRTQMETASGLMGVGLYPFVPLLFHFQHLVFPRNYEEWMAQDLGWLEACDCVLRLPGESKGADREVAHAKKLGIPVFYTIGDVVGWSKTDWRNP